MNDGTSAAHDRGETVDRHTMALLLISTVLTYCTIYAPQPLLPLFAHHFAIPESRAALLTTVTLLPLSIAPLSYGFLLESWSALKLLRLSLVLLALSELAFVLPVPFGGLLGIRLVQGLVLPAAITALMTTLSRSTAPSRIQQTMAAYVAATIVGGYLGRLLSGLAAAFLSWQVFFVSIAAALLLCVSTLHIPPSSAAPSGSHPTLRAWVAVLGDPIYLSLYITIFCLFGTFAGLLNFLPFRLVELQGQPSELMAGLIYTGYLVGVATSLGSKRIARRLPNDAAAMLVGIICFIGALIATAIPDTLILFISLFLFCGAMFLVHALAAGIVNQRAAQHKGLVNGLYVAFYYAGGVFGSSVPGPVYEWSGWTGCLLVLLALAGVGLGAMLVYRHLHTSPSNRPYQK